MIYIDDCIDATVQLLKADSAKLKRRTYNLAGISFSPEELAASMKKYLPDFTISYEPDFRQKIADAWPRSIDDSAAKRDWGWKYDISLDEMVVRTIKGIDASYKKGVKIVGI